MQFLGCERHRTTAYHPAANGLVERFHRQLKVSLMARNSSNDWLDHLPLVLLGLRTTIKSDLDACPAELVYGSPLRLLGELLAPSSEPNPTDMNNLLQRLRRKMSELQAIPTRPQSSTTSYMDPRIKNCTHVFLRCDKVKRSLQPPL